MLRFNTASGKYCCNLSTMATFNIKHSSFNTASGKYCCNLQISGVYFQSLSKQVSIPQAVSTVATFEFNVKTNAVFKVSIPQAVSTVATIGIFTDWGEAEGFNTASGKYCCNAYHDGSEGGTKKFQYRKR